MDLLIKQNIPERRLLRRMRYVMGGLCGMCKRFKKTRVEVDLSGVHAVLIHLASSIESGILAPDLLSQEHDERRGKAIIRTEEDITRELRKLSVIAGRIYRWHVDSDCDCLICAELWTIHYFTDRARWILKAAFAHFKKKGVRSS